jgi:hypothetical protein
MASIFTTSEEAKLEFSRRGRGVSYHDIELALGPIGDLDFMIDRQSFQMKQNQLRWLHYRQSTNRRYANMLAPTAARLAARLIHAVPQHSDT